MAEQQFLAYGLGDTNSANAFIVVPALPPKGRNDDAGTTGYYSP